MDALEDFRHDDATDTDVIFVSNKRFQGSNMWRFLTSEEINPYSRVDDNHHAVRPLREAAKSPFQ